MEAQVTLARNGLSVLYYGFVSLVIALLVKVVVNAYGRLDFGRNAETTSPTSEVPKAEEQKTPEEPQKVTNGEVSAEEAPKAEEAANAAPEKEKSVEEAKPVAEQPTEPVVEEPKVPEPVVEKPVESAPSPVKEEVPPPVEEPTPKVEEPKPIEPTPVVEEIKEVRSEEVPPPLPSSNPPSPVTVFAESTKADALPADQVPLETPVSAPVVETIPEPVVAQQSVESIPQATSSPVVENVSDLGSATLVEGKVEALSSDSSLIPEQSKAVDDSVAQASEISETELNPPSANPSLPALDDSLNSSLERLVSSSILPIETVTEPTKEPETNPIPPPAETQQPEPLSDNAEPKGNVPEQPQLPENPIETQQPDLSSGKVESNENKLEQPTLPEPPVETPSPVASTETISSVVPSEIATSLTPVEPQEVPKVESQPSEILVEKSSIPSEEIKTIETTTGNSELPLTPVVSATEPSPPALDPVVAPSAESNLPSEPTVSPTQEVLPEPIIEQLPEPLTEQLPEPVSESVVNADSLPDISTESLPSLPEPLSENLAEPMSLPPVDSVPEPIATDSVPECPVSVVQPSTDSPVLTNGNANGLPSPTDEVPPQAVNEGPLKQVPTEVITESESRQVSGDTASAEPAESAKVEE